VRIPKKVANILKKLSQIKTPPKSFRIFMIIRSY
jgi:hypothetical protein